jgi:hypothetical protein
MALEMNRAFSTGGWGIIDPGTLPQAIVNECFAVGAEQIFSGSRATDLSDNLWRW